MNLLLRKATWLVGLMLLATFSFANNTSNLETLKPNMNGDLILVGLLDGPISGTPKFVEIYVVNNIADLSAYGLGTANNGGGTDGQEYTFPAVSLTAGQTIYVANDTAQFRSFMGFGADFETGVVNFNGDDAVEVFQNGLVIDIYGLIDTDGTGTSWEYTDSWARRMDGTGPDDSTFVESSWTQGPLNVFDGTTTNASATVPYPLGPYMPGMTGSGNPQLLLVGIAHGNLERATEYYVLDDIADLSVYGAGSANNGGGTDGQEFTFPAVSATKGDRIWVARDSADFRNFFGFDANFLDTESTGAHNFNGDDAFEVFFNGVAYDVYGDKNVDGTGEPWEYDDTWAYRDCATSADTVFDVMEWTVGIINDLDTVSTNAGAVLPFPIGTWEPTPCSTPPVNDGGTDIVLTEIMYNSPGTDLEYLEFYNNTMDTIDMTGYSIADAITFTFPTFSLNPGELVVISDDSVGMSNFWGVTAFEWASGSLNNGGESVTLKDASGAVVDSVRYDDDDPWTSTADGRGPSIILCEPDSNNNEGFRWQRSINSSGNIFDGREVFGNPGVLDTCVNVPIVGIQAAEIIVNESVGEIQVSFYIDNGNSNPANVNIGFLAGGTADASDLDIGPVVGVPFPVGPDTPQVRTVFINDDNIQEPREYATLRISNPTNCIITNDTLNITIIDDDAPLTKGLKLIGLVHGPLSGVPKAVEILAVDSISDLSIYGLGCANNGGGSDGQEYTFPAVSMSAGSCFFVANDTAAFRQYFGFEAMFQDDGAANNFNGDDAFEIFESGKQIDVFGEIDADGTGTAWEYTLGWAHRVAGTGPDSAFTLSNWTFSGIDALVGTNTNADAANPYPFGMCTATNIVDGDFRPSVWVYPNPAGSTFTIDTKEKMDQILIFNKMGQMVMKIDQPDQILEISTSNLPAELYLIRGISEKGSWTKKLLINK
ncbi:MAG: lamin tail domain-containing protein [Bacteroidota bacterium]